MPGMLLPLANQPHHVTTYAIVLVVNFRHSNFGECRSLARHTMAFLRFAHSFEHNHRQTFTACGTDGSKAIADDSSLPTRFPGKTPRRIHGGDLTPKSPRPLRMPVPPLATLGNESQITENCTTFAQTVLRNLLTASAKPRQRATAARCLNITVKLPRWGSHETQRAFS